MDCTGGHGRLYRSGSRGATGRGLGAVAAVVAAASLGRWSALVVAAVSPGAARPVAGRLAGVARPARAVILRNLSRRAAPSSGSLGGSASSAQASRSSAQASRQSSAQSRQRRVLVIRPPASPRLNLASDSSSNQAARQSSIPPQASGQSSAQQSKQPPARSMPTGKTGNNTEANKQEDRQDYGKNCAARLARIRGRVTIGGYYGGGITADLPPTRLGELRPGW